MAQYTGKDGRPLMKIPMEALLKHADAKLKKKDEEIRRLNQTIGELKAYIDELEDAEKKEVRIQAKALKQRDLEWESMKQLAQKQRKTIREQHSAIGKLLCEINQLNKDII